MFLANQVVYGFINTTGSEVPPYGAMIITGAAVVENEIQFTIRKPTTDDELEQQPANVLFNGIQPVPNNREGVGTRDLPAQALIEQPSTDHPSGLQVGPKANSFALSTVGNCFKILAKDLTNPHVQSGHGVYFVEGSYGRAEYRIGRTLETIAGRSGFTVSKGDVELFRIDETDTLVEVVDELGAQIIIEAYNVSVDPVENFRWVDVFRMDQKWHLKELCQ